MPAELRLHRNIQASVRMVAVASLVGGALTAAWLSAADKAFGWHLFGEAQPPWAALAVVGALVTSVVAVVVVWRRQPNGARITWDEWGVTEWDGDSVRTAIAAQNLRKQLGTLTSANLAGHSHVQKAVAGAVLAQSDLQSADGRAAIGGHLVLSDEDGRRIDVTQGVQNATLNRRLSTVDRIAPLATSDLVQRAPPGSAAPMPESENLLVLGYLVGIVGYLGAWASLYGIGRGAPELVWFVSVAAALVLALRSLPWWFRARRLRAPDRGAVKVTIEGGSLEELRLREAGTVDLRALKHPDAGLALRTGEAWLTRGKDGEVAAIETTAARDARHRWARATRTEAALRSMVAALVLVPAMPQIYRSVRELARGVEGVEVVAQNSGWEDAGLDLHGGRALTMNPFALVDVHTGQVTKLDLADCQRGQGALSPDGRYAVLSCVEHMGPYRVFALPDWRELGQISGGSEVHFAFDGPSKLFVGDGADISVWELPAVTKVRDMPSEPFRTRALAVSPTTHEVVYLCLDTSAPFHARRWSGEGPSTPLDYTHDTGGAVAFSPDGKRLAVAVKDGGVELFDYPKGEKAGAIAPNTGDVTALAFSPDGSTLAIATQYGTYSDAGVVYFVDVPSMKEIARRSARWRRDTFDFVSEEPKAIDWNADGSLVVLTRKGVVLRMTPVRPH